MVAVVDTPAQTTALAQVCFTSSAVHIIQQDEPCALSEVRAAAHRYSHSATQLLTHHVGIHHVPVVVTHCAPWVIVAHLHPTLTPAPTVHQSYFGETSREFLSGILSIRLTWWLITTSFAVFKWDVGIQVVPHYSKHLRPMKTHFNNMFLFENDNETRRQTSVALI